MRRIVVGSSFYGKVYENNSKYIVEAIHKENPKIKLFWLGRYDFDYPVPKYIKIVKNDYAKAYFYAISRVLIDTHMFPVYLRRRGKQLIILAYHGGIGMKKNSNNVPGRQKTNEPDLTGKNTSYCISNSLFMNGVIRSSLMFKGPIWMVGYPKNDILHLDSSNYRRKVFDFFNIKPSAKVLLYAPTYRLNKTDISVFNIDFKLLSDALENRFGGEWVILIHLHPHQKKLASSMCEKWPGILINANDYPDMQELIVASDILISDYSSCMFEAMEKGIPCFMYAVDYETYRFEQGFYFDVSELPFPYSKNNNELINSIYSFDYHQYVLLCNDFKKKQGLVETDKSSVLIAKRVAEYLNKNYQSFEKEDLIYD